MNLKQTTEHPHFSAPLTSEKNFCLFIEAGPTFSLFFSVGRVVKVDHILEWFNIRQERVQFVRLQRIQTIPFVISIILSAAY
jgi:hypothetical protein